MDNEHRLREILREELNAWGQRIGLDVDDPMETQADFRHLRRSRKVIEGSGLRAVLTIVTLAITGGAAALWLGITSSLHR